MMKNSIKNIIKLNKFFNLKSMLRVNPFSLTNYSKFGFSENKNDNSDSGIHSDFQPKVKKEINDENVMQHINELVTNNDILLFMKGTKEMPRCGFSNYLIQVLKFYKVNFKDVNVLENEVLRNSVKEYSNWPTFPQLYVKGELVGGCDIVKEMHETGAFEELLKSHNLY